MWYNYIVSKVVTDIGSRMLVAFGLTPLYTQRKKKLIVKWSSKYCEGFPINF